MTTFATTFSNVYSNYKPSFTEFPCLYQDVFKVIAADFLFMGKGLEIPPAHCTVVCEQQVNLQRLYRVLIMLTSVSEIQYFE